MTSSINICQNFVSSLSFLHLIRFRVDNARVLQQVSMNLNMTVGQGAFRLLRGYIQITLAARPVFAESYRLLLVNQVKELVAVGV